VIYDSRNAIVGGDGKQFRFELIPFADVHWNNPVRKAGLFQKNRDLVAVGCDPVIEVDHRSRFLVAISVQKGERGPRDAFEQRPLGLRAGENPDAEQDAEQ